MRVIDLFCLVHGHKRTQDINMEGVQDVEVKDHMAEEKVSRNAEIVQSSIFDSFTKLESGVESSRVAAGITLLRHLHRKQRESENGITCREVKYALHRLIRGLCTTKPYKRAGFFSVLVEMLILFPNITVRDMMDIIENELQPMHNCSKKEITEIYSGQVLAIGALIHSNKLIKESQSTQTEILGKLIAAGEKKKMLCVSISAFLIDFMQKIDEENFRAVVWPLLKTEIRKSWEEHTLPSFHLLLQIKKQFPKVVKKKYSPSGEKDIFHEHTMLQCSKLLMNSSLLLVNHPVYEEICCQVCTLDLAVPFWKSLLKENELRPSQYKEQVLLNFLDLLLQHMTDKTQIPDLLCCNFMELIIKIFQTKKMKADLAQKANKLFTKMSNILEDDNIADGVRMNFIECVLFYPGNLMFDKMTGTKIVIQLCSHMKVEAIEKLANRLIDVISACKPKIKNLQGETCLWSKWERSHAAQLFTRLLSLPVIQENTNWKVKQLKFLITVGFIASPSNGPVDIANLAVATEVRNCVFKVLEQKVSKVDQLIVLLTSIVHHLHKILFVENNPVKLCQPLSESSVTAWEKMIALVNEIESQEEDLVSNRQSVRQMFLILFLHMGLQLFQNATLAEEALQELHCCYERMKSTPQKKAKRKSLKKNDVEDVEPYWVEVIVDLLLSLLSGNSYLLRNVVGIIFPHLCPHLTPTAVHQIIQVLDPHGKQPLSSTDTEGEDESDEAEADDKEIVDKESEEVESGSDDDDDYDESDCEPVDTHLKLAVQNALKKAGGGYDGSDEESIDMDQMTEEQRNGLDAALSEAFKLLKHNQAQHKRKKQSKDDEALMHFRVRVMDLLDMYIMNQPALSLVLDIMLPLFELLEFCIKDDHQKPLEIRIRYCLKKLSSVKHFSTITGVDQEILSVVLRRLLQKGERAVAIYQNMSEPLVQCSTFLAKTFYHLMQQQGDSSSSKRSPVLEVYEEALTTFFKQRESLLPLDVIKSVIGLPWNGASKLANTIIDFAFDFSLRPFRRNQALELLLAYFTNSRLIVGASPKLIKKLMNLEEKLSNCTIQVLVNVVNEKEKKGTSTHVKEKFFKEMFCLLFAVWHAHNRSKEIKTASAVDWEAVKTAVARYWEVMSLATDTKVALKKLSGVLQISLSKKHKVTEKKKTDGENRQQRAADENESSGKRSNVKENSVGNSNLSDDEEDDSDGSDKDTSDDTGDKGYESGNDDKETIQEEAKKRKRPKTNNLKGKAIMKKKSKEARLLAMAQGLDDAFSFAQVDLSNLQELTGEKEEVVNRKRKRKHLNQMEDSGSHTSHGVFKSSKKHNFHKFSKKSKVKGNEGGDPFPKRKKHKVTE